MLKHSTLAAVLILLGSTTAVIAKSDNPFLTEAIQINLAEIAVGDLAQKNAGSEEAKAFGQDASRRSHGIESKGHVTCSSERRHAPKRAQT